MSMKKPTGCCRVGRGAYAKAGDKIEWTGGLYAIQEQMKLPIHAEILKKELKDDEKTFLLSIKEGQPNWSVMGTNGSERIPFYWF